MKSLTIAFHGGNVANFRPGFERLVDPAHVIVDLSEGLRGAGEKEQYEAADVIVGIELNESLPQPRRARLFHAPAAGTDKIDVSLLPPGASLCNCFGHEGAIAEYVMTALLLRYVPIAQADSDLRQQRWTYWAGRPTALRSELGASTLGLLGYGHIAKAIAARAKAFGVKVVVANRSPVTEAGIAQSFGLDQLREFMGSVDAVVVSLPLTPETLGVVGASELAAMRPGAVIINVGRGPVIDETALYEALVPGRIDAVIDTWYQYPTPERAECAPSRYDFASLRNVVMTPHMSGWTQGTIRRRQETIADNIRRLQEGKPLVNVLNAVNL